MTTLKITRRLAARMSCAPLQGFEVVAGAHVVVVAAVVVVAFVGAVVATCEQSAPV